MKNKYLALALCCFLLFSGCRKAEENTQDKNQLQEEASAADNAESEEEEEALPVVAPVSGGTLKLSMRTTQTLNPIINEDASVDKILHLIFEPLLKIDENHRAVPSIAKSWYFSEDGLNLTMNLDDNHYWHDGKRVTAEDVVFTINAIKNAGDNTVYKKCAENIASASASGSNTVNITFASVFSGNIYYLTFPVIPAHCYSGNMAESEYNMKPVGSGPYKFDSFVIAKELNLLKADISCYIDAVKVLITPDKDSDLYSFDQGVIDCISADETDMGRYDNSETIKRYEYTTSYYDFIGFNFNSVILSDLNIRKAIAFALPKEAVIEGVYLNHAVAADTPVSPKAWYYEPETAQYEYNLATAKTLLNSSGWTDANQDNILEKSIDGQSQDLNLRIMVNTENEERKQVAKRLSEELRAIGINTSIDEVPFADYVKRLEEGNFDLFIGGWQLSSVPDMTFMFGSNGYGNYTGYNRETMDTLLAAAYGAVGEEAVKTSYSALQKYIAEDLPYISLVFRNSAVFTDESVYGEIKPMEDNIFDSIASWFIKSGSVAP